MPTFSLSHPSVRDGQINGQCSPVCGTGHFATAHQLDRKSTRLNSSHLGISYAVFCLKKKKNETQRNVVPVRIDLGAVRFWRALWLIGACSFPHFRILISYNQLSYPVLLLFFF